MSQIRLGLVYRSIYGPAPRYLSVYFPRVRDAHTITAPDQVLLMCAYTGSGVMLGKGTFLYTGASEWNELPLPINTMSSLDSFKK